MPDAKKMLADLREITAISATKEGNTRFSYSEEDRKAKQILMGKLEAAGLTTRLDGVGNLFAYRPGEEDKRALYIGSHMDTVPEGGPYDGLLGTMAAAHILMHLEKEKIETEIPVALIVFAEEEGSAFGGALFGSRIVTGAAELTELDRLYTKEGVSARELVTRAGYSANWEDITLLTPERVAGFIELHIEQGGVLDAEDKTIGVVSSIVGIRQMEVILTGVSNHAGTTPMHMRNDPMVAAAHMITEIGALPKKLGDKHTVATVGRVQTFPGGANVIPSEVRFTVDIRDVNAPVLQEMEKQVEAIVDTHAKANGVQAKRHLFGTAEPVHLDEKMQQAIRDAADEAGVTRMDLPSGAGHDAELMALQAPTGMIFVPSIGGVSHSPYEDTKEADLHAGLDVMYRTVKRIAGVKA